MPYHPPFGTAPRRISPGVWTTRKGKSLTPNQATVWERYYRTGYTDGRGHITKPSIVQAPRANPNPQRGPSGNLTQQTGKVKKPGFDTVVRAKHGDPAAIRQQRLYNASKNARATQKAAVDAAIDQHLFGQALPAVHAASKVVNPIASSIITAMSPTTSITEGVHALARGDVPNAALAAAGLIPAGRGGKAIEAAMKAERAARLAELATKSERALPAGKQVFRAATGDAAKAARVEQEGARTVQRGERIGGYETEYGKGGQGKAGHIAGKAALKGKLAEVSFDNLTHLDEPQINQLMGQIDDHPKLHAWERLSAREAILRMHEGKLPRPFEVELIKRVFGDEAASQANRLIKAGGAAGHDPGYQHFSLEAMAAEKAAERNRAALEAADVTKAKASEEEIAALTRQTIDPNKEDPFHVAPWEKPPPEPVDFTPGKHPASEAIGQVINIPRSIMSSADLSFGFRQALVASAMEPRLFAKNFKKQFREFIDPKRYEENMAAVQAHPDFERAQRAGVSFTDLKHTVGGREEEFPSSYADKLTGGKHGLTASSSRAYTGFANRLRMDIFAKLLDDYVGAGVSDEEIATLVNWATGRGNLKFKFDVGKHHLGSADLERASGVLNTLFFSPRLFQTRIQAINPFFYSSLSKPARMKALGSMAKLISAGTTVLGLILLAGGKVNLDPTNSDFGKGRVGSTRFDIWGGHQQLVRLFMQVEEGKVTSSTTGKALVLGGGIGHLSRRDITQRFFEGKLAPTPSLINDWFKGTDFQGNPFSWKKAVVARSYPLLVQDVRDVYHNTGSLPAAAGIYGIGAFGVGVQNYGPKKPKPRKKKAQSIRGHSGTSYRSPHSSGGSSYRSPHR